jgi:Holliday junction DNA helicase RuvA
MIRSLTGTITHTTDTAVVLDVRGVGYLVGTPNKGGELQIDDNVTLHTHLAVRETALDLYGFSSHSELDMFELLLNIPKVGPKSALQILLSATPNLLIESAQKNDPVYLHKMSGIGKKTCENIVLYLHKKVADLQLEATTEADSFNQTQTDAIDALIALGYDVTSARESIKHLADKDSTVNSLVTQALKHIQ